MKAITGIAVLLLFFPSLAVCEQVQAPTFTALPEAVRFIVRCIDEQALERFTSAFIESRNGETMQKNVFEELTRINKNTPLIELYANHQFPSDDSKFLLGGHAKELGFINITFIKKNDRWNLVDAYFCR